MRVFILSCVGVFFCFSAMADVWVNGYTRSDGTYVQGYWRSSPDNSYNNNWGVKGNTNPYTGEQGNLSRTNDDQYPRKSNKCVNLLCN